MSWFDQHMNYGEADSDENGEHEFFTKGKMAGRKEVLDELRDYMNTHSDSRVQEIIYNAIYRIESKF